MAYKLNISDVAIRESRLGSIIGYCEDLNDLVTKSHCESLKGRERCFSQSSSCASGCAMSQLLSIRDVAVIYHAPAGCSNVGADINVLANQIASRIDVQYNSVIVGTDMNEHDTIFGALNTVRKIVKQTYENYHPKAIFISSSCVVVLLVKISIVSLMN